jgi:acetylornithine deacetylase/succinyl-diaminopimelate desuccinylase-like protein
MKERIKNKILNSIAADKTEIVEFTKDLVAIATENPPGNHYKPCVDLIINKLSEIGLDYEIIEVPESESLKRYCIVSSYGPGLLTVSHGPGEYVEIDSIMKHTAIYALTALDYLSR